MNTQVESDKTKYYGRIGIGAIIAILCSSCFGMVSTSAAVSLLATFMQVWPDSAGSVMQVISLPSLLMIPPLFIVPYLSRIISKKYIMMGATLLYFIGGFFPIFSESFAVYLTGRCLIGLAAGFMISIPTSMVGQLFEGKKATSMLGGLNATASIIAMVVSTAVGVIAMGNWRNSFWIFMMFLVLFVLQWIFVPKLPPEKKDATMPKVDEQGNKIKFPNSIKIGLAGFFVYFAFQLVFIYTMSGIIANVGGTPAQGGFANSLLTLVSFLMSLVFIPLYGVIKRWVLPLSLIFQVLMFFCFMMATSVTWVFLAAACTGSSITLMYTYMWKTISVKAPRCWISTAMASFSVCAYVAQWLSPYLMGTVINIVGPESLFKAYVTAGIVFLIIGIVNVARKEKVQTAVSAK